ncbi:MATE family efflux transporter [Agathobacter sp.]
MKAKTNDLTKGNITKGLWGFAIPLMFGNVLQQLYNLVDTWVVGRYVGDNALAAVGSSYTLMTFLTSIIIGLCLGSSSFISMAYGRKRDDVIRNGIFISSIMIGALTLLIMVLFYMLLDPIISVLQVPSEIFGDMRIYLFYVFMGFAAVYIYNYVSNVLRGLGNSVVPLVFLAVSVVLNIFLDILFVAGFSMGIKGAAVATVIAQYVSGAGILIYFITAYPVYRIGMEDMHFEKANIKDILSLSGFTCLQQSVMNFGILCVQGIVNSFGTTVMAAFAVAVKIDTIAYMPVQDFGNAFSVFVAQNFGAGKADRIRSGIRQAAISVIIFCVCISAIVCGFARLFMSIFVDSSSVQVINVGVQYLRIEGAFYIGIGILFMLYGYYRAVNRPMMSVVLTVISLGTRVLLAYVLSAVPAIGVVGIWMAIPIGWFLADAVGIIFWRKTDDRK